jgi:hypothetical protein
MSPLHSACDKLQDNQSDIRRKRLLFRSPRIRRQGQPGGKRGWPGANARGGIFSGGGCISSPCRWITRRTCGSWSKSWGRMS